MCDLSDALRNCIYNIFLLFNHLTSRELTDPTWGKGKPPSKVSALNFRRGCVSFQDGTSSPTTSQPALQPGSLHKHCFPMHMAELEQVPMHDVLPEPLRKKKIRGISFMGTLDRGGEWHWEEIHSYIYIYIESNRYIYIYIHCIFTVMWFLSGVCNQTNSTW